MAKAITGTGQGFGLPGRRLGGFSRKPPLSGLLPQRTEHDVILSCHQVLNM